MKEKNNFCVAMATMHQTNEQVIELCKKSNLFCPILVINQCDTEDSDFIGDIKIIYSKQRGLSNSRNMALDNICSEVMMIADDDLIYENNVQDIVLNAYKRFSEYDVICFKSSAQSRLLGNKLRKLNLFSISSVSSVQISFKVERIKEKGIRFNPLFGTGSSLFTHGEENVFLKDCIKAKLKILYIPTLIVNVPESDSTWFKGFDSSFFQTKGALMYELYGNFWKLMALVLVTINYNSFKGKLSLREMFKEMKIGKAKICQLKH